MKLNYKIKIFFINFITNLKQIKNIALFIYLRYSIGDQSTQFLYDIVYQQQHESRDSNKITRSKEIEG